MKYIKYIALALVVSSCDLIDFKKNDASLQFNNEEAEKPIARAHDQFLYYRELEGLIPSNLSKADSANRVERYIKSWINKQLVISEASNKLNLDEVEIERKVLDYRYALMIHEYQNLYITEKLDMEVGPEEIDAYYEKNKDNFKLRQNIIKCRFVKLPREAPRISFFKGVFQSNDARRIEDLKSYCYQYASTFHLDTSWVNFDEVIVNTPMATLDNKIQFLKSKKYHETSDETYNYYLSVSEYKVLEEISPVEWVKDDIEKIIINKRKVELAKELEEGIYERAVQNNDFEIFD